MISNIFNQSNQIQIKIFVFAPKQFGISRLAFSNQSVLISEVNIDSTAFQMNSLNVNFGDCSIDSFRATDQFPVQN
jgi:hypothetical protein